MNKRSEILATRILGSAARTGPVGLTYGETFRAPIALKAIAFQLDLTAAAADAEDILNVWIQTSIDGVKWANVIYFSQCLGDGGAKRYIQKLLLNAAQAELNVANALSPGDQKHIAGDYFRAAYSIVDESETANSSYTFSVDMIGM